MGNTIACFSFSFFKSKYHDQNVTFIINTCMRYEFKKMHLYSQQHATGLKIACGNAETSSSGPARGSRSALRILPIRRLYLE